MKNALDEIKCFYFRHQNKTDLKTVNVSKLVLTGLFVLFAEIKIHCIERDAKLKVTIRESWLYDLVVAILEIPNLCRRTELMHVI